MTHEQTATYDEYLLVDFENVPRLDLGRMEKQTRVFVFVGDQQQRIPFGLVESAQALGDSLEWCKISGQGRNALDFHIAFYLGELNQTAPKNVKFTVLSGDRGYDPLVAHLTQRGRACSRISSLRERQKESPKNMDDPETNRILQNLGKIAKAKRPRTRNTLSKYIASMVRDKVDSEGVAAILDNLFIMGKVSEHNRRLQYDF